MHVLILGAGAVGAFYGAALAQQGVAVSVVCRSDYEVVRERGLQIRSPLLGDHVFKPQHIYRHPAECAVQPDVVLLTTKVSPHVDRVALLRPVVRENTAIVLIQNGVEIESPIAQAFAHHELISGIAFIGVSRVGPGEIWHQQSGALTLGRFPEGRSALAERLAGFYNASGVSCRTTPDIVAARWQKAVWNVPFNLLSIVGGGLTTAQMLDGADSQALVRTMMQEVCAVAAATGHPLRTDIADALIASTSAMQPYKTSMALDYERGRPMEVDAILGATVRAARRTHTATPTLDVVYAIAKMIEKAATPRG